MALQSSIHKNIELIAPYQKWSQNLVANSTLEIAWNRTPRPCYIRTLRTEGGRFNNFYKIHVQQRPFLSLLQVLDHHWEIMSYIMWSRKWHNLPPKILIKLESQKFPNQNVGDDEPQSSYQSSTLVTYHVHPSNFHLPLLRYVDTNLGLGN